MNDIKPHDTQQPAQANDLISVRPRFDALAWSNIARFICLSISAACLSGCSGFGTDSFSGDALSSPPILPPEPSSVMQAEPDPGIALDDNHKAIDQLAQMVGATAKNPADVLAEAEAAARTSSQDVRTPAFRFTTEMPVEPDFDNDFPAVELAAPVIHKDAEFIEASASDSTSLTHLTEAGVMLVAATEPIAERIAEPIGAGIAIEPNSISSSVPTEPEPTPQPLKPIVDSLTQPKLETEPEPTSLEDVTVTVGLPPLSAADMHELTQSFVAAPSLASHQSVDLSKLELESNLAAKPTPPAPQPQEKALTPAEHLSETIRLIEETVAETSVSGEHHGAEPGVRLLQILREKMDQVSPSNWRLSNQEHQYWQQQLEAVSVMFESESINTPDGNREPQRHTATRAIEHLERAAQHLRSMAGLRLHGGQLCSQILGFGKFEELESNRFQPGDRALIYVEVENHSSQVVSSDSSSTSENSATFQTRLQASYVVHDLAGKIVHEEIYPAIEDLARRHRRDFYLHLPITIFELSPGEYQITVSIKDLANASKATLPAIDFLVVQPTD